MLKLFCFCTLWISDDAKGKRYIMPISVIFFKVLIFFGLGLKAKTKKMKIWLITVKTVICLGSHTYIFDLINIYLWIWLEVWKILVNNCVLNLKTVLAEISLLIKAIYLHVMIWYSHTFLSWWLQMALFSSFFASVLDTWSLILAIITPQNYHNNPVLSFFSVQLQQLFIL